MTMTDKGLERLLEEIQTPPQKVRLVGPMVDGEICDMWAVPVDRIMWQCEVKYDWGIHRAWVGSIWLEETPTLPQIHVEGLNAEIELGPLVTLRLTRLLK